MADPELMRLWEAVRQDFDRAKALLPAVPDESNGNVTRLNEWLDHNELELALYEFEELGEDNNPPPEYWSHLRCSAVRMNLPKYVARFSRRIELTKNSEVRNEI